MTPARRNGLLVFAAALALRLGALAAFPPPALEGDQLEYDAIARHLASDGDFALNRGVPTSTRAPLYPLKLAAVYKATGGSRRAAYAVQAVLGAATAGLLYLLVLAAFDARSAAVAGALAALYPVFIHYDQRLLSENLMTLLTLASVPPLWSYAKDGRLAPLAASALVAGVATLTRPGTMLLPFAVAPLAALRRPFDWRAPLLYAAVFAAVLLPWQLRNKTMFGHWTLCSRGPGFGLFVTGLQIQGVPYEEGYRRFAALTREPRYLEPTEPVRGSHPYMELESYLQQTGKAAIKERPLAYLALVAGRLPRFWLTSHSSVFGVDRPLSEYRAEGRWGPVALRLGLLLFHAAVWALALLGLWLHRARWRELWPLAVVPAYFTIHILFDLLPRYGLPAMTCVFAFAAAGAVGLAERARPRLE